MNRHGLCLVCGAALVAFVAAVGGADAAEKRTRSDVRGSKDSDVRATTDSNVRASKDFEVTGPDGRRILLSDDGRWRYIDSKPAAGDATKKTAAEDKDDADAADGDKQAKDKKKPKDVGEAVLTVERKLDGNRVCRFGLRLVNNLTFEVRSIVPEFKAYRPSGVVYDTVFGAFQFIRPGDSQVREIRFDGIACPEIARVQVTGGDRCEMGDLDKFSRVKGACLSHLRVVESDLVRFDK